MITTRELLELAQLDALGLLDPEERESFDAAFDAAAPAVQGQIRREQSRLTLMERTLPDVTPPASLRENVLAAVRGAIAAMAREASPLRLVGRASSLATARHVAPAWRAAAIGLAAAAVVFGASTVWMFGMYSRLSTKLTNDQVQEAMKSGMSAQYVSNILFDASTKHHYFKPEANFTGYAVIFTHAGWPTSRLVGQGFDVGSKEVIKLVTLNDAGDAITHEWASIAEPKTLFGLDVPSEAYNETRLALVSVNIEDNSMRVLMKVNMA